MHCVGIVGSAYQVAENSICWRHLIATVRAVLLGVKFSVPFEASCRGGLIEEAGAIALFTTGALALDIHVEGKIFSGVRTFYTTVSGARLLFVLYLSVRIVKRLKAERLL